MTFSMILRLVALGLSLIAEGLCIWMLVQDKKLMNKLSEWEKERDEKLKQTISRSDEESSDL